MADFKCKICGGELVISRNDNTGTCKNCGAKTEVIANAVDTEKSKADVSNLVKRIFIFLEDGDFKNAYEYSERVLDIDVECTEAYLGKLMAEVGAKNQEELQNLNKPFNDNPNYHKILRFGNENLKKTLNEYINRINSKNEYLRKEGIYTNATRLMSNSTGAEDYRQAVNLFKTIPDYKDSADRIKKCLESADIVEKDQILESAKKEMQKGSISGYENAMRLLAVIPNWRDTEELNQKCIDEIERLKVEKEVRKKKAKKTLKDLLIASAVCVIIVVILAVIGMVINQTKITDKNNKTVESIEENVTKVIEVKDAEKESKEARKKIAKYCNLISVGEDHLVGLKSDGTVVAVGADSYGQCDVEEWEDIVAVSAGDGHTVGLKSDGTVVAVGNDYKGRCDVEDWKDIVAISAGFGCTVGLKSDGTVVAVGGNNDGQCDVETWNNIVAISTGGWAHTAGLKSDGTVVAVGDDSYGKCDVEDWEDIVAISADFFHTVGLKSDGTVVAVGENNYGQCDVEDWKDIVAISAGCSYTVGLKKDGTVVAVGNNFNGRCDVVEGWKDIVAISAGDSDIVGLKKDGTVVAVVVDGEWDVEDWDLF